MAAKAICTLKFPLLVKKKLDFIFIILNNFSMISNKKFLWGCLVLTFTTAVIFYPVLSHNYTNLDDHIYVTKNKHVGTGLNLQNLQWAFTSIHGEFYHPLTWVSLMVDTSIYGIKARGYLTTNLMLHVLNTLLLFYVFYHMTGFLIRSLLVAALFALHPLHVESVAWISGRKDLLCTFFWYVSIWAYISYIRRPRAGKYAVLVIAFIFGLLSKPMIITLPCVLLLLDIWPLKRVSFRKNNSTVLDSMQLLLKEKAPLFFLSIAGGLAAIYAQKAGGGLGSIAEYPMTVRLSNALISYKGYILKTLWPHDLAVYYPYLLDHSYLSILTALLLLIGFTCLTIFQIRTRPYLFVGWLWFLGTMIPVIGIFKIGDFSMADRYTYIPVTGLFIIIIWSGAEWLVLRRGWRYAAAGITALVFMLLVILTSHQITFWRTSEDLYRRALEVTEKNYMAHYGLGHTLASTGRFPEAVEQFKKAAQLRPDKGPILINLARALTVTGNLDEAILVLQNCVAKKPENQEARFTLGLVLAMGKQYELALKHFHELFRQIQPFDASAIKSLNQEAKDGYDQAVIMEQNGRIKEAAVMYQEVIDIQPDFLPARDRLSRLYVKKREYQKALAIFQVENDPKRLLQMILSGFDQWKGSWRK
jgi:tetratricopeptide (TPR) repeat protein